MYTFENKNIPLHMQIASAEIGQREITGPEHNNPRILEYNKSCTYHPTIDEVPWCAFFVNWVLQQANIARTKSGAALSFLEWGVKTNKPEYGDILVINRGGGKGHVAFFTGTREENGVTWVGGLGGNQNDEVNITWFPLNDIQEFRTSKTPKNSATVKAAATGTVMGSAMILFQLVGAYNADNTNIFTYIANNLEIIVPNVMIVVTSAYTWWERLRKIKLFNN